jgi:hypothetical protein
MIPDTRNAYREAAKAMREARSYAEWRDRWTAYLVVALAWALIPVVSLVLLFKRRD